MAKTPKLGLPLIDSGIDVSVDHLKINEATRELDAVVSQHADAIESNRQNLAELSAKAVRDDAENIFSESQHIEVVGAPADLLVRSEHDNGGLGRATLKLVGARTDEDGGAPLVAGDTIGQVAFAGVDGNGDEIVSAYIKAVASQSHRNGSFGTKLEIASTPPNAVAPRVHGQVSPQGVLEWNEAIRVGGVDLVAALEHKANAAEVSAALDDKADRSALNEKTSRNNEFRIVDGKAQYNTHYGTSLPAKWKSVGSGIVHYGAIANYHGAPPPGTLPLAAGARTKHRKDAYPGFWTFIRAIAEPEGSRSDLDFYFGYDADHFFLPATKGQVIRAIGGHAAAEGTHQGDAIRNIIGEFAGAWRGHAIGVNLDETLTPHEVGALHVGKKKCDRVSQTSEIASSSTSIGFDASRVVPTAAENRMVNWALPVCVVVGGEVDNPEMVNAAANIAKIAELQSEIATIREEIISLKRSELPLGEGQEWKNVTTSRSVGTTYRNTTGRSIALHVRGFGGGVLQVGASSSGAWIDVGYLDSSVLMSAVAIVPSGNFYRVHGGTRRYWSELR